MHQIKNLFIESSFPHQEEAKNFQNEVGSFLEESWQKSLSHWLDEVCPQGQYIRIDRLDIEINFQGDDFDLVKWNELVMNQIKERIQDELALKQYDVNENLSIVTSEQSWLTQWMVFWQTGHLPWNAIPEDFHQLITVKILQKHRREITLQKDELLSLMSESHFFVRAYLSMEFEAFQLYLKLLQQDINGLPASISMAKQDFIALSIQPTRRDVGEFLFYFWQRLIQDNTSLIEPGILLRNALLFIYHYQQDRNQNIEDFKLNLPSADQSFISFLEQLLVSHKDKLPSAWSRKIMNMLESPDSVNEEILKENQRIEDEANSKNSSKQEEIIKQSNQNGLEKLSEWHAEDTGVVLLHPFIQMLFQEVGIYNDDNRVLEVPDLAIQVLHYLVFGASDFQPHRLTTIKCLCGLDDNYVLQEVELSKTVKTECDQLLNSVIKHWKALKKTSPEGLREAFLQRKGLLISKEDKYVLKVEKKAYDILLEHLPWNYSIVKLPWMDKPMYVEW